MIIQFLNELIESGIIVFGLFILVLLAAIGEAGMALGSWAARRQSHREADYAGVSVITSSMLAVMAFLLALTINFSQNRFEARRQATVEEANAIGTAWLRSGYSDAGQALASSIAAYAQVRLAYLEATQRDAEAAKNAETNALQTQIWRQALGLRDAMQPQFATALLSSLNDMFDAGLIDRYALESRVPVETSLMLLGASVLAIGALGYQMGLGGHRQHLLGLLLLFMLSGGMTLVVDLSQPGLGFSRIDTTPMVWAIQGFSGTPVK